jgi:ABC-type polysaccharide/polyol phosphate export permease
VVDSLDPVVTVTPVESSWRQQVRASREDFVAAWRDRQPWLMSAIVGMSNKYRRTVLGPWWTTLTTLLFVFGLSLLRVGLGGGSLREAIPYVGLGFIGFFLISGGILAGMNAYVGAGQQLSTSRLPYSAYVLRAQTGQVLDFLHDAVVIVVIVLLFAIPFSLMWGWSIVAVLLIVLSSIGVGLWLGPLAARFRDVGPFVSALMRLMFFLTPIFWSISEVEATGRSWMAWWNPLTYQLLAFRDPILGQTHPGAPITPMTMAAILVVFNLVLGLIVFTRFRARIPYWVSG